MLISPLLKHPGAYVDGQWDRDGEQSFRVGRRELRPRVYVSEHDKERSAAAVRLQSRAAAHQRGHSGVAVSGRARLVAGR